MIDDKFEKSPTFSRIKQSVEGKLIFIDINMINEFLSNVLDLIAEVKKVFYKSYKVELPSLIANYYFNRELSF